MDTYFMDWFFMGPHGPLFSLRRMITRTYCILSICIHIQQTNRNDSAFGSSLYYILYTHIYIGNGREDGLRDKEAYQDQSITKSRVPSRLCRGWIIACKHGIAWKNPTMICITLSTKLKQRRVLCSKIFLSTMKIYCFQFPSEVRS